ncbi:hypothetical protein [Inquilinus sp. CAU 1745]|uniref:hypothetical protein n=1 Tax=Inquilinus sp. CAU 1745 TaxID=3140369 RepID=UPI00325BC402
MSDTETTTSVALVYRGRRQAGDSNAVAFDIAVASYLEREPGCPEHEARLNTAEIINQAMNRDPAWFWAGVKRQEN